MIEHATGYVVLVRGNHAIAQVRIDLLVFAGLDAVGQYVMRSDFGFEFEHHARNGHGFALRLER